jgi:hypothetical protein
MSTGTLFSVASSGSSSKKQKIFSRNLFSLRTSKSTDKVHSPSSPLANLSFLQGKSILFQSTGIRKHFLEKGNQKPRNRRWVKFWMYLTLSSESLDLVLQPMESHQHLKLFSDSHSSNTTLPFETNNNTIALSSQLHLKSSKIESFNILHSVAHVLRPMAYSTQRPFVFSLLLSNNSTYLYHVPTQQLAEEWVKQLNYAAARKSKEPLRDVLSSADYGWTQFEWERKKAEMNKTEFNLSQVISMIGEQKKKKLADWEPPGQHFGHTIQSQLEDVSFYFFFNDILYYVLTIYTKDTKVYRNNNWLISKNKFPC